MAPHEKVGLQTRPDALAGSDRQVRLGLGEVDHLLRGLQAHGNAGVLELERAEVARQPAGGEGRRRVDGQRPLRCVLQPGHGVLQDREGFRDLRRQPQAGVGEADLSGLPQEELFAQRVLQKLDLIADRRLRQAQLRAGPREAHVAGGGLEDAHCVQRKVPGHLHA